MQIMLGGRSGETLGKEGSAGTSESAYSNNKYVNKCGWRRWIMLDGRVGETFVKKGSAGTPESAYSNNRVSQEMWVAKVDHVG